MKTWAKLAVVTLVLGAVTLTGCARHSNPPLM